MNKFRMMSVFVVLAMLFSFANVSPAHAAIGVIFVNSDADTVADDGVCTLREAITAANSDTASGATAGECAAGAGADTIIFTADYTITLVVIQLPAVTSELTITGNGAANSIIQANAAPNTAVSRVFQMTATGNLTLDGVTVRHGRCYPIPRGGDCGAISLGGGIYNAGGTLTVTNSTISGNSGGGIYNDAGGMVTVTDSTLSGNTSGGGIYNDGGTLTVTNSTLSGNSTNLEGGGIYNYGGTLTVTDSTLSGNSAEHGGGINNNGFGTTVTNSTLSGNSAGQGGGILNEGTLTVTNSTLFRQLGRLRRRHLQLRLHYFGTARP
jgi:CSLREA domain-containing protein